jgi:hypothetical protein
MVLQQAEGQKLKKRKLQNLRKEDYSLVMSERYQRLILIFPSDEKNHLSAFLLQRHRK